MTCKYNSKEKATKECHVCEDGLCSSCGYTREGKTVCNECLEDSEYYHEGHLLGGCHACK